MPTIPAWITRIESTDKQAEAVVQLMEYHAALDQARGSCDKTIGAAEEAYARAERAIKAKYERESEPFKEANTE